MGDTGSSDQKPAPAPAPTGARTKLPKSLQPDTKMPLEGGTFNVGVQPTSSTTSGGKYDMNGNPLAPLPVTNENSGKSVGEILSNFKTPAQKSMFKAAEEKASQASAQARAQEYSKQIQLSNRSGSESARRKTLLTGLLGLSDSPTVGRKSLLGL